MKDVITRESGKLSRIEEALMKVAQMKARKYMRNFGQGESPRPDGIVRDRRAYVTCSNYIDHPE